MRRLVLLPFLATVLWLLPAGMATAKPFARPANYSLEDNATLVHPGELSLTAVQLSTTESPYTWGAVQLDIPTGMTFGQLNYLSTNYKFTLGSCWGGSPRFEMWVTDPAGNREKIFAYIGPPPDYTGCPLGVWTRTGNLVTPTSLVDDTEVGGTFYDPYSDAQAKYGSYPLIAVWLDADGGWDGNQTVDLDNSRVNDQLYTYEQ